MADHVLDSATPPNDPATSSSAEGERRSSRRAGARARAAARGRQSPRIDECQAQENVSTPWKSGGSHEDPPEVKGGWRGSRSRAASARRRRERSRNCGEASPHRRSRDGKGTSISFRKSRAGMRYSLPSWSRAFSFNNEGACPRCDGSARELFDPSACWPSPISTRLGRHKGWDRRNQFYFRCCSRWRSITADLEAAVAASAERGRKWCWHGSGTGKQFTYLGERSKSHCASTLSRACSHLSGAPRAESAVCARSWRSTQHGPCRSATARGCGRGAALTVRDGRSTT